MHRMTQAAYAAQQIEVACVAVETGDERAIDFQSIGRQLRQVAQRGKPDPEIIDGYIDALAPQRLQLRVGFREISDRPRLGYFNFQQLRRQASAPQAID